MADAVLSPDGATQNPVDPDDGSSDATAVETIVVGVSGGDAGAGFVVGDPGLAASAEGGGAADISGARANPLAPVGSSGEAGDIAGSAAPVGGSVAGGDVAPGSADGALPAGDEAAILDAGGTAPADAPATPTAGGHADTPAPAEANGGAGIAAAPGAQAVVAAASNAGPADFAAASSAPPTALASAATAPATSIDASSAASRGATTDTVSVPGSGLVFDNTFESSVTPPFEGDIIAAEKTLAGLWTNSVALNLDFTTTTQPGGFLAENSFSFAPVSYSQLTGALTSHDEHSSYAQDGVAALPATDPIPDGSGADWSPTEAYARMLGLSSGTSGFDSTITLNTSYGWSYSQDVVDTMEHEISEGGMGRVGGLGDQNSAWSTMDLFRYSSAGKADYTDGRDGQTTYFSYDGGLKLSSAAGLSFNNEYTPSGFSNSDDTADFTEQDVFGIGATGETDTLSPTDIQIMEVLGWDPDPTVVSSGFTVSAEQTSSGITVLNSGTLTVASGGTVSVTTLGSGGLEVVSAGGTDSGATISSGAEQDVFGNANAVVVDGGLQVVETGGSATSTTIDSGGSASVSSGGAAAGATLLSGGSLELFGSAIDTGLTWSGGTLELGSGFALSGQAVGAGQTLLIQSGGSTTSTTIDSGGLLTVSSGGLASITSVASGGTEAVAGDADSSTIGGGGSATVFSGGTMVSVTIAAGGTLDLASGAVVSGGISLTGSDTTLVVGGTPPTIPITGFTAFGDVIDLTGLAFSGNASVGFSSATDVLTITEGGGSATVRLDTGGSYSGVTWFAQSDSGTGTDIAVACFCRGTRILTAAGEVPVEDLAIGDEVMTVSGTARPVKWIGHRTYDGRFVAANRAVLPICITADALADSVPTRDLSVSPEHALYLDGALAPAGLLVNGVTIRQVERVERVEYFHVELDAHDVLFAEGAPAETFVDCDNRLMFQNAGDFAALYPDDARAPWQFCAPRLEPGSAELATIRAQLLDRAAALGYALAADPDPHLIVDGEIVRPHAIDDRAYRFTVSAGARTLAIASRSAVPAELDPASQDRRRLGVAVERIVLCGDALRLAIGPGHAGLSDGFHANEGSHRWTDGLGRLPEGLLRPFAGAVTVELHLSKPGLRYALAAAGARPRSASCPRG